MADTTKQNMQQHAIYIYDLKPPYSILEVNDGFRKLTGYSSKDLSSSLKNLSSLIYPDDFITLTEDISRQILVSNITNIQHRLLKKNGDIITVLSNGQIYTLKDGRTVLQCVLTDITNLETAALERERAKSDLDTFARTVPSGVSKHKYDNKLSVIWANDYFYKIAGYTPEEWDTILHGDTFSLILKEDLPTTLSALAELTTTGKYKVSFRIRCKDGSIKWLNALSALSTDSSTGSRIVNMVLSDITALKISEMKAELEEKKYLIISDISAEIPYEYNLTTDVITYAAKYYTTFGRNSVIKHPAEKFIKNKIVSPDTIDAYKGIYEAAHRGDSIHSSEYKLKTIDGDYEWYFSTFSAIKDQNGKTTRIVGLLRNIHKEKVDQLHLLNRAQRDSMTGLYNKQTTENRIQKHLRTITANSYLMLIDIDDFKNINDTYGHLIGDQVIHTIADALKLHTEGCGFAGRVGGDEFAVYLTDVLDEQFVKEKATLISNYVKDKFTGENDSCKVTLSIGISMANSPMPYATLVNEADTSLYDAKLKGKNCFSIYNNNVSREIYHNDRRNNSMTSSGSELPITVYNLLNNSMNISEGIINTISYLLASTDIDTINIYTYATDRSYLHKIFSSSSDTNTGDNHPARLYESLAALGENQVFYTLDPNNISIDVAFTSILAGINEYLQITITNGNLPIGYVVFTSRSDEKWSMADIENYSLLGKLVSSAVSKYISDISLDNLYDNVVRLLNSSPLPTYIVDKNTYDLLYINDVVADEISTSCIGKKCHRVFSNSYTPCTGCPMLKLNNNLSAYGSTSTLIDKDGCYTLSASPIAWMNRSNACVIYCKEMQRLTTDDSISEVLTSIGLTEELFDNDNYRDSLTGYSNFEGFSRQTQQILSKYPDRSYALYYINVKNFKLINEAFGHDVGDATLKQIADIFNKYIKSDEAFARVISDTFVLFKEYTTKEQQITLFQDITNEIRESCTSIQNKYLVDFSAGILVIDSDNNTMSINKLIDRVILATKGKSELPGTNYTFYEDEFRQEYLQQANMENTMHKALATGEFLAYFQPKYDLINNQIIGSEALVRWSSPINGFMQPDTFIPVFERNGFISEIDLYMLEEVCKTLQARIANNYPICPCSVNLSRVTLSKPDLVHSIMAIIEEYSIPSEYIEFEITENVFVNDFTSIIDKLNKLRANGFAISMDDFGSGYSSLTLLKDIPLDVLKLDKQFLDVDTTTPNISYIMKSIIDMAKLLNIRVVCEGVETPDQAEFLKNIGCEVVQGYLYGKPMCIEEFNKLLK